MRRAIREHSTDFIAITVLIIAALFTGGVILSQQQQPYPSWIPFLGDERFELKAELSTAQAVAPGQGQTINIAGVTAGDISEVELVDGHALVTMLVEEEFAPLIHSDATVLLRPRTGLQDMTLEVDPGSDSAPQVEEGYTIPLSQTKPNVMPDQILASLDGDTQAYLQLLIAGGAEGLGGRGKQASAGLRRFEPLSRYVAQIGDALVARRENIAQVVTSFRELSQELARLDVRVSDWVTDSNAALGDFADQEASLRETLQELPAALRATQAALRSGNTLALELGPASEALIPAAQTFAPAQQAAQGFFNETIDPVSDQIRPFSRQVQDPVRHLKQAAGPLADTTKYLTSSVTDLNRIFNSLAYNPPGSEEGYLFWAGWLNHNTNSVFNLRDAHGPIRRGIVLQSCNTARVAESFATERPFIRTLQDVTNVPRSQIVCPLDGGIFSLRDDPEAIELGAPGAVGGDASEGAAEPGASVEVTPEEGGE